MVSFVARKNKVLPVPMSLS